MMKYDKIWYENLNKPSFTPPDGIFAPVWFVLYLLMFVSLILILSKGYSLRALACYIIFFVQLAVNIQWSDVFFKEHNLFKAFVVSAILAILVAIMIWLFLPLSKAAGMLLIPYFLWCCFATLISYKIYKMN